MGDVASLGEDTTRAVHQLERGDVACLADQPNASLIWAMFQVGTRHSALLVPAPRCAETCWELTAILVYTQRSLGRGGMSWGR